MNFSLGVVLSEVLFIKKTDARCVKIINYFMLFAAAAVMYLKGPEHLPGGYAAETFSYGIFRLYGHFFAWFRNDVLVAVRAWNHVHPVSKAAESYNGYRNAKNTIA